jgi:hypothetical protein
MASSEVKGAAGLHWRAIVDEKSNLPWPSPAHNWAGRAAFSDCLDRVEKDAERIAYRGFSRNRICNRGNGHEALRLGEWEWPSGFRHYVIDHDVRPLREFEIFILERGKSR